MASHWPRDDPTASEMAESVWELRLADGRLEGVVVWANQAQAELFGLERPEDAIGKTISEGVTTRPPISIGRWPNSCEANATRSIA
jgi:hypothetical protein